MSSLQDHNDTLLHILHIGKEHCEGVRVMLKPAGSDDEDIHIAAPGDCLRCITLLDKHSETCVLAVTQSSLDIKSSLQTAQSSQGCDQTMCELYYNPQSDNLILRNTSCISIQVSSLAETEFEYLIGPMRTKSIGPKSWKMSQDGRPLLDFMILPRVQPKLECYKPTALDIINSEMMPRLKCAYSPSQDESLAVEGPQSKSLLQRRKLTIVDDEVVMTLPSNTLKQLEVANHVADLAAVASHPLTFLDH